MKVWFYRLLLFGLLFGVSSLTYGANQLSPILTIIVNLSGLAGASALMISYFYYPASYKFVAWVVTLGVIGLVLESLYIYNQYVYSFFVIKRFAYCGLALLAYIVATRSGELKLSWAITIIFAFYFISQIAMGKLFTYSFTSETRTTTAYESYYLVIPFLYFFVRYLTDHKRLDLLKSLATFALIVILLHRSVISTAVFAVLIVVLLSGIGKIANSRLKIGRTVSTLVVLVLLVTPFLGVLSQKRTDAFLENIAGILSPTEDNTGNWRYEQSLYYWKGIEERPFLGWRYEGYDRGEVMENEDFAEKGTVIHSQYIDMLYNYGIAGLCVHLFVILSTLLFIYFRNRTLSSEQAVLFGFIASSLLFGVSYQLPVYFWGFVGVGMAFGRRSTVPVSVNQAEEDLTNQPEVLPQYEPAGVRFNGARSSAYTPTAFK